MIVIISDQYISFYFVTFTFLRSLSAGRCLIVAVYFLVYRFN